MNKDLEKALETIPDQLSNSFFPTLNELLQQTAVKGYEMSPLETAEVMHRTVGSILATYLINLVEPSLREYVAAKMLFQLSANLFNQIKTLEDTIAPVEAVDNNKPT